jgi:hypothetical protein
LKGPKLRETTKMMFISSGISEFFFQVMISNMCEQPGVPSVDLAQKLEITHEEDQKCKELA